ncbi:hypothetical protein L249_1753 [Ophiocordyceps polyrhachis-furcata BCC 54312]|uniref:Phosphoribosylaminoimidazole-succinocarboxamide synthase n=1 Tax=Ophiocordyceps polyrhachis-furcata BCC 54312 TaxID=1330021 RepID=A0A367LRA9_9HYPO|nr:hypothetical protein L249_1753 [Ophiocordyceps polyrhachis-furcata BCC 54312]
MALAHIHLPSLQKVASGKVRDLFTLPDAADRLLFVASDRLSAFDVVMENGIPNKGAILTLISAHWFGVLVERVPGLRTHFLSLDVPACLSADEARIISKRSMQVRRLQVLKIEAIVRGYITGSAWVEYQAKGTVHGLPMPAGMRLAQPFAEPIYTPSTKAEAGQHDENIHPDDAWKELGDRETARQVQELSLTIYRAAAAYAEERGIIIADTKFEFAKDAEGNIYLVDEVLTPDSSRFWRKDSYEVGREQDSFDKQFVRDWLISQGLKGKTGVEIPEQVCRATEQRYKDVFRMLTGKTFEETIDASASG